MFVCCKDVNIVLQIHLYKINASLFFNCIVITMGLLHSFLRCFLYSTNCDTRIGFSALYSAFKLPKCPLSFANVGVDEMTLDS